jgi:hypothetical protein
VGKTIFLLYFPLHYADHPATKTTKSKRTITLLPPVRKYLDQIRPLHVRPNDYILKNRHGDPIDQDEFAARHFWRALRALNIRHRDFYATRDTFISVMLMHGEPAKRIAEYCGTSLAMIESSYGKWIGGSQRFGEAALKAAQPKPTPKPKEGDEIENEQMRVVRMAERGGFEPPVPLLGVHTISSRAPSTARSPLRLAISSTYARHPAVQFPKCLHVTSLVSVLQLIRTGGQGQR